MDILLIIHSFLRWLIVLAAVLVAIKFAIGWLRGGAFENIDRRLASGFSGLMDLQVLIGLILLIWGGLTGAGFPSFRILHTVVMFIAAIVAHLHVLWKNSEDKTRFRFSLFIILDVLIIIFVGLAILPTG